MGQITAIRNKSGIMGFWGFGVLVFWVGWVVGGISSWSLVILMHGDGVLGGLGGWWDF